MFKAYQFKARQLVYGPVLLGLLLFQNCSRVGFDDSKSSSGADSQSSASGASSSATSTSTTPTSNTYAWVQGAFGTCVGTCGTGAQTATFSCVDQKGATAANSSCQTAMPNPVVKSCALAACPVTCSSQEISALYSSAKSTLTLSQNQLATNCVDATTNLAQNLNIQGNAFATNRYLYTCASRWCTTQYGMAAIGTVTSTPVYDGSGTLVAGATATVECYINQVAPTSNSACATIVQNAPSIQSFSIPYNAPGCGSPCGCNATDLSAALSGNPEACGDSYCQAHGFSWGILDEVGESLYAVTCSMTAR